MKIELIQFCIKIAVMSVTTVMLTGCSLLEVKPLDIKVATDSPAVRRLQQDHDSAYEEIKISCLTYVSSIKNGEWNTVLSLSYNEENMSSEMLAKIAANGGIPLYSTDISLEDAEVKVSPGMSPGYYTAVIQAGENKYELSIREDKKVRLNDIISNMKSNIGVIVPQNSKCAINGRTLTETDEITSEPDTPDDITWTTISFLFDGLGDINKNESMKEYILNKFGLPADKFTLYVIKNIPADIGMVQVSLPDGRSFSYDAYSDRAMPDGFSYDGTVFIADPDNISGDQQL